MSKMKELFEKVAKDRDLQSKYVEINQNGWKSGEDTAYNKLIDFAKDAGYNITIDEVREFFEEMTASKEGELPNSELDKIAGGLSFEDRRLLFPGGPGYVSTSVFSRDFTGCIGTM